MVVVGLIFVLAAAIWLAAILQRGGLLAGCLLVILSGTCAGHAFFHISVLTLDRVLWVLVCGLCLWQLWQRNGHRAGWTKPDVLLAVLMLVMASSTFSHDWRYDGAQPASRFLFLFVMPLGLYCVVRHVTISPQAVRWLAGIFSALGLYLAVTAIAEARGIRFVVFPRYILSNEFPEFLGRGRGPLLNPSANGIYIACGLACLWCFWPSASRSQRVGILVGSGVMAAGGLATLTRCVWLGMALTGMLAVWLTLPRRQSLGLTLIVASLGSIPLIIGWDQMVAFKRDKNVSVADMRESAKLRPMLAAVAWQVFRDHPVSGVGFGQYKQVDPTYIAARDVDMPLDKVRPYHQHNVVLSLLTEVGLVGTVPFLLLLASWTRTATQLWRHDPCPLWLRLTAVVFLACLINYLANGMFQDVSLIPMVNSLLFFLAGVQVAVAEQNGVIAPVALSGKLCVRASACPAARCH